MVRHKISLEQHLTPMLIHIRYVRTPAIPAENQDRLSSKGVIWAETADAAAASLHLASDPLLNGKPRTLMTLHR